VYQDLQGLVMLTWLLTFTTYGTWLPGDPRGFVGRVHDQRSDDFNTTSRREHDQINTPYDADLSGLYKASQALMKGDPVWLTKEQATMIGDQFVATAEYRKWILPAFAVMPNHVHLVVTADGAILSDTLLQSFKSYASRRLNSHYPKPTSGTWWTQSGSRRILRDDAALDSAIRYVKEQYRPLVVFISPERTV
jgi:REP element-mobilizing transposase RayT